MTGATGVVSAIVTSTTRVVVEGTISAKILLSSTLCEESLFLFFLEEDLEALAKSDWVAA